MDLLVFLSTNTIEQAFTSPLMLLQIPSIFAIRELKLISIGQVNVLINRGKR